MATDPDSPDGTVIAVVSAANALESAAVLLREVSPNAPVSIVYLDSQSTDSTRKLVMRLSGATPLQVSLAVSGQQLNPGHVFVIPPGVGVVVQEGVLTFEPLTSRHPAILDRLLSSVAGERSIAVVLSASDGDGLEGLRALKAAGGVTLVREPEDRQTDDLVATAISAGLADRVLPPVDIGRAIPELAAALAPSRARRPLAMEVLQPILRKLLEKTGVDFSGYRPGTLQRRVARRMALLGVTDPGEFVRLLVARPVEIEELFEDLLIHVTSFFRGGETYETLVKSVIPDLVRTRKPPDGIRVWVPGCSTGEEVYSVAMLLLEAIERARVACPIQIFASDISDRALARAREGHYPETIRESVSDERLRKYFTRTDRGYQVVKRMRELCIFVRHDLTRNPSFSRMDLVSCRNLLIYFDEELQKRALSVFHFALRPGGHLLLGESETLDGVAHNFDRYGKVGKIYVRRTGDPSVVGALFASPFPRTPSGLPPVGPLPGRAAQGDVERHATELLLSHHVPAAFLVNERLDILHLWGPTSQFIAPSPGKPELNLLRLVRPDLRADVRIAIHQANRESEPARRERLRLKGKTVHQAVKIEVEPLPVRENSGERFFLVLLTEAEAPAVRTRAGKGRSTAGQKAHEAEIQRLRSDLASSIEYGQSFVKEYESVNASLSAANEEIVSTNEELQSTNEELETAKEELQAANEELLAQNLDLSRLNADLTNLLSSSEISILLLDGERRIRRSTPYAQVIFGILPNDQGRHIGDLKAPFRDVSLDRLLTEVLRTTAPLSREVQDQDGKWHSLQIRPYRVASGKMDGAVLSVHDIDAIKRREEERAKAELANARLAAIVESSDDAIISKSLDGVVQSWNQAAQRLFGYAADEMVGKSILTIIPEERRDEEREILSRLLRGERIDHFETDRRRKDGSLIDISLTVSPVRDSTGRIIGASKVARDITRLKHQQSDLSREVGERRKAEDRIRDLNQTLEGRVRERTAELEAFSYSIAHDLRGPLRSIHRFSDLLGEDYAEKLDEVGRDYLKRLAEGAARMDRLIDDLLDYSRVARADIRPHAVDLNALCAEVRHELAGDIAERKGRLIVHPDLPGVMGDRLLLRQALINLVSNALKFVAPGTAPEVMITAEPRPGAVRIRIQDNGIGIPQDYHGRVFRIFERLNPPEAFPGTGVGLAIVKKAVERMDGTLGLDSEPGRGSTFWIELPISR